MPVLRESDKGDSDNRAYHVSLCVSYRVPHNFIGWIQMLIGHVLNPRDCHFFSET